MPDTGYSHTLPGRSGHASDSGDGAALWDSIGDVHGGQRALYRSSYDDSPRIGSSQSDGSPRTTEAPPSIDTITFTKTRSVTSEAGNTQRPTTERAKASTAPASAAAARLPDYPRMGATLSDRRARMGATLSNASRMKAQEVLSRRRESHMSPNRLRRQGTQEEHLHEEHSGRRRNSVRHVHSGGDSSGHNAGHHHHHHHHHHGHHHHSHGHRHHTHEHGHHSHAALKGDAGCVEALLHQEALLLEQVEYWRARGSREAELRQSWESELEEHRKLATEESARLREETESCQALLDAERQNMEDMEAQIAAWHDEQKEADGIAKLKAAELRVATRNVHDLRVKIKAKHRMRVGGGLPHGQGELRYLAEAEADSFRERIAVELQIQLQDLPLSEVPPVINQILKTESAEKDSGSPGAVWTIMRLQHRVKRLMLRRRLLAAAVAENAQRQVAPRGSFHSKRDTASMDQILQGLPAGSDAQSAHEHPSNTSAHSSRAKEHKMVKLPSKVDERVDRTETTSTIDRSYEDALNKLSSVGAHL